MMRRRQCGRGRLARGAGFTLLEVLVASVLMAAVFVAAMSVMSGSLRNLDRMRPHQLALTHARELMTEELLREQLAPERSRGQWDDGDRWQVEITPLAASAPQATGPALFRVRVDVAWGDPRQPKTYRLETVQLAKRAPENH